MKKKKSILSGRIRKIPLPKLKRLIIKLQRGGGTDRNAFLRPME